MADFIPPATAGLNDDESLNAGTTALEEPVGDVLSQTIEADPSVIMEMIPKLQEGQVTTESIYNALNYIREDLEISQGMTQSIATEAISVLPNFGRRKPVNFYSKHPSATGWQAALEEIDTSMANDVVGQLSMLVARIDNVTQGPQSTMYLPNSIYPEAQFEYPGTGALNMLYESFRQFQRKATDAGFAWDDKCFQGVAVDKSQNAVPGILTLPKEIAFSFASMDAYYLSHLEAPAMLEMMELSVRQWITAFQEYLEALKSIRPERADVKAPTSPTVNFAQGKVTSADNIGDIFKAAADGIKDGSENWNTIDWAFNGNNAESQMVLTVIRDRLRSYSAAMVDAKAVLEEAIAALKTYPASGDDLTFVTGGLYKLATAFTTVQEAHYQAYTGIVTWGLNASLAAQYIATLIKRVTAIAWISIHQCKDTLQMPEGQYDDLKLTMLEITKAPEQSAAV